MITCNDNKQAQKIRSDISIAAQKLFRRKVVIEERVFQSIEALDPKRSAPRLIDIWNSLSLSLPSIHQLYAALEIDIQTLSSLFQTYKGSFSKDEQIEITGIKWNNIFRQVFCEQDIRFRKRFWLTKISESVLKEGTIGPKHIISGILHAKWFSEFYKRTVPNPVLRHLAKASGLSDTNQWSEEIETFSQKAFDVFRLFIWISTIYIVF
jgi:hypothetical protein